MGAAVRRPTSVKCLTVGTLDPRSWKHVASKTGQRPGGLTSFCSYEAFHHRLAPILLMRRAHRPMLTVLDPFAGAGTVGLVADRLGRDSVLIEISQEYAEMARERIHGSNPMFSGVTIK